MVRLVDPYMLKVTSIEKNLAINWLNQKGVTWLLTNPQGEVIPV